MDKSNLRPASDNLEDYLVEIPPVIRFNTPLVQKALQEIRAKTSNKREQARLAFEMARDDIQHSFDTKSSVITISAEEALEKKEGICFAKAHLLATLTRALGIPTGFCYQRVLRKGTIESGYALHGLNAIYLEDTGWFRVDPRGNKSGINAQFTTDTEQLAYPIRPELGEIDYPYVFTSPLDSVIDAMETSEDCHALFYNRPEAI
ncbi:MAG: transglutaminase domain-containing protein [Saprospiraceae bacterium]|nr:MAG: Transglutaminase-like superfamily protein [Bacteroidetes bacterium OLB9]MCO6462536.1 transglutaminase domain-containing protein [Saprospiraceae bacterium]MCZ2338220.1 transglutaminase-like domain-containing protein [Chitinophagales bacterium]